MATWVEWTESFDERGTGDKATVTLILLCTTFKNVFCAHKCFLDTLNFESHLKEEE